jgi:hypothetical protein
MKKNVLLFFTFILLSGCIYMPTGLTTHERKLWIHQNKEKKYYYKTHPNKYQRFRKNKRYKGYFMPGRW